MTLLLLCFLLGYLTGLRSLTPAAAVCWAAHLGWLHFAGTKLAFLGRPVILIVFTLLALEGKRHGYERTFPARLNLKLPT